MIRRIEVSWRSRADQGKIPVEVVYSSRRTLGLEVRGDGRVILRSPKGVSGQVLMDFVKERQEWIVEKWFLAEERRKQKELRPLREYEKDPSLEKRFREKARKKISERVSYYGNMMGVDWKSIRIGSAKTRWGSCSAQGGLNFQWKLILMPPEILDYVVVHELAHRREMNHSPRFWALVEKVLPDYRERRKWLKEHGGEY